MSAVIFPLHIPLRIPARAPAKRTASLLRSIQRTLAHVTSRPLIAQASSHPDAIANKVVVLAAGRKQVDLDRVKALPPIEKQVLRTQVEGELTTYFRNLRNSLMLGLLNKINEGLDFGAASLQHRLHTFVLEVSGIPQLGQYVSAGYSLPQLIQETRIFLAKNRTSSCFSIGEVREHGWPNTIGVTFDPAEMNVANEVNNLLIELESDHRLVDYLDMDNARSTLHIAGIDNDDIEKTIDEAPLMGFTWGTITCPPQRTGGMEIYDIHRILASSPFNIPRYGHTDGSIIRIYRNQITMAVYLDVITDPDPTSARSRQKNALAAFDKRVRSNAIRMLQALTDLHIEDTRYHEEGHCSIERHLEVTNAEQSWCSTAMGPGEIFLLEALANLAPPAGDLKGVYAHIYDLANSRKKSQRNKAQLLLHTRLVELETESPFLARIERPILDAIFPKAKVINLRRFKNLWDSNAFGILAELFKAFYEARRAHIEGHEGPLELHTPLDVEKRHAEAGQDFANIIDEIMRTEIMPRIMGQKRS